MGTSSSKQVLELDNGRRAFEVNAPDGTTFRWEYDIVSIKLYSEILEKKHGMRREGSDTLAAATPEFLKDFAQCLSDQGLINCSSDAAFAVHQIVNAQFIAMSSAVQAKVNALLSD